MRHTLFFVSLFLSLAFFLFPQGGVIAGSCECKTSNISTYGKETVLSTECKTNISVAADCETFRSFGRHGITDNILGQISCVYSSQENCEKEPEGVETAPSLENVTTARVAIPEFNIPIPGMEKLSAPKEISCGGNKRCLVIPWIGIYIGAIYRYALSIITLVAVAMIMIGGMLWLTAGGSSDRVSKAKEYISGAVIGLLIAIFSYTLLATINPALVRFEDIQISYVSPLEGVGGNTCNLNLSSIVTITDAAGLQGNGKQVTKAVEGKLKTAAGTANAKGYTLVVNSGVRSPEKQETLRKCYEERDSITGACPKGCSSCNLAAKVNCSAPHMRGIAVDVVLTGGGLDCGEVKETNNCRSTNIKQSAGCSQAATACQDELYDIMTSSGFTGIRAEWWHFEI